MIDVPVAVKDALREGTYKKNYRFVVLNDDGTPDAQVGTIDNDYLVSESVSIDERMCSGDTLKFGLCEGSSLEFQYFNKPNITGKRVQAFVDVEYGESEPYTIPMGFFDVKKCSRQASTGIIKATCYNKLQSDYLDADATEIVQTAVSQGEYGDTDELSMYSLLKELLGDYGINEAPYKETELRPGGVRNYGIHTFPLCNSSGTEIGQYVWIWVYGFSYNVPSSEEYYLFNLYTNNLIDFAIENVWGDYKGRYTKYAGSVKTLEELALSTQYTTPETYREALTGSMCIQNSSYSSYYEYRFGGESNLSVEYSRCSYAKFYVPVHAALKLERPSGPPTEAECLAYFNDVWANYTLLEIFKKDLSPMEIYRLTSNDIQSMSKVTLRELQSAVYETSCQFGQLSRITDLFSGVELNHSRLLPADTLYPADSLYPSGAAASGFRSMYSKLWADEGNVHKWRYLIITYKGLDEEQNEKDFALQRTVNADGTDDYNMSDNWLFRNLVWTAADVGDYADAMVAKMQDVTWFPFEMWCAGLPYIETGDEIEIPLGEHSYTSYVLQRQLKGIQNLQDTYINGTLDIF